MTKCKVPLCIRMSGSWWSLLATMCATVCQCSVCMEIVFHTWPSEWRTDSPQVLRMLLCERSLNLIVGPINSVLWPVNVLATMWQYTSWKIKLMHLFNTKNNTSCWWRRRGNLCLSISLFALCWNTISVSSITGLIKEFSSCSITHIYMANG